MYINKKKVLHVLANFFLQTTDDTSYNTWIIYMKIVRDSKKVNGKFIFNQSQ